LDLDNVSNNNQQYGFTGALLPTISGAQPDQSYREKTPDGGYIFWQQEIVNGKRVWMPQSHVPPDKRIEA
jgi:hypothetical protein